MDFGEDFHSIPAGECQIEQHQIIRALRHLHQASFARFGGFYFKAFHLQQGLK